ncbi:choice-of-anchor Q domain-containing protein, partial [Aerosakkonemataceae cyanobacterium BLCC-F154]
MNNYSVSNPLILEESLQVTQEYLKKIVTKPDFLADMQRAFGNSFAPELALSLVQNWAKSDFSDLPKIEIHSRDEINGANGAFASATNTVYLSEEFLKASSAENIASVLLEEIGHAIDARLNQSDSPGDEGAIFSALVRGKVLSPQQLAALKTEDDTATITLDGQALKIEQSNLVVNTILDTVNPNDGKLSLREAIEQANSTSDADTITFDPSLSGLGIYLTGKALDIVDSGGSLTIQGLGENQLTIDADGKSRVFNITTTNPQNLIAIEEITISGGQPNYSESYGGGGGISNSGNLTLSNVTIRDNKITYSTSNPSAGGIYNTGVLTLSNVTISNNRNNNGTYSTGGGISNTGTIIALNSTIQSNVSAYGNGGGIYNSGGTLTLINTTVSGNTGAYNYVGGGIYTYQGTVSLINSTVSGNSLGNSLYYSGDGGGIYNDIGFVTLSNSTVSNNSQAGISNHGSLDITNSIIANNSGGDFSTVGIIRPHGINLIEDGSVTGLNIINADPNLGPLQNNAGLTPTHALLVGSLAIDAGDNTVISPDSSDLDGDENTSEPLPFDQRGVGFSRIFNGKVDLGAFESSVANASGSLAFSAADYSVNEDGTTIAAVTVTRTGGSDGAVSVNVNPTDGTATAPNDYDNTPILVSFAS